ncbi:MAG: hypothetical protein ACFFCW_37570 [Candidatus Hodarchaeota archaeon]
MLERIHLIADSGTDFGFETTLSGKGYVRLLRDLRDRKYQISLFFLWVNNSTSTPNMVAFEKNSILKIVDTYLFSVLSKKVETS